MIADKPLKEYLLRAKEATQIRDAGGEVLGYYVPAAIVDQVPALRLVALFDLEELERRKASTHPGSSFDQVKEHLRSMEEAT
jgi:hypothetical protein